MENILEKNSVDLNLINMQSQYEPIELIAKSEFAFQNQINELSKKIISNPNLKVILVAGPSSAGKTTSSKLLRRYLENNGMQALVISMDNFFINREITPRFADGTYDFENVDTLDIPYFKSFIDSILKTRTGKMPIFNFHFGRREDEYIDITLPENGILIIEGIHALNPKIISNHESELFRVFVCLNTEFYMNNEVIIETKELRRMRRLIRDFYTRGITVKETLMNWKNVCAGEAIYIDPFKNNADFILDSTHLYEPLMYKKYLPGLLDGSEVSKEIANDLKGCLELDASLVPPTSLINEFLEGVIKKIQ